ncbi:MAG TPA: hypothetical protein VN369_02125 [Terriglobales bacterium]|nr:hypothetical protein [Terriglobales bacterium]
MDAFELLEAMNLIDDKYIEEAWDTGAYAKVSILRRVPFVAVLVAAALTLCGFTAYELGWLDGWLQRPSGDPVETVRTAIENQMEKAYTIEVRVLEIAVDEGETARVAAMYAGSELAKSRGWTDEYLDGRFLVVRASYYVRYDHTKTFLPDGSTIQYFYLTQDVKTGRWTIVDNTSPDTN